MPGEIVAFEPARDPELDLVVEQLRRNQTVALGDPLGSYANPLDAALLASLLLTDARRKVTAWARRADVEARPADAEFWGTTAELIDGFDTKLVAPKP